MGKAFFEKNRFLLKLIIAVVLCIAVVTVTTLTIVLSEMNKRYINTMTRSALLVIEKTRGEMRSSAEAMIDMIGTLRSNWALRAYISDTDKTSVNSSYSTYSIVNTIGDLLSSDLTDQMEIVIVGADGAEYITDGGGLAMSKEDILDSEFTRKATADPTGIHYQFLPSGITWRSSRQQVFVASAAVVPAGSGAPIAYIYISISQEALRKYYSDLSDAGNFIILLDDSGKCVSSTYDDYIGWDAGKSYETARDSVDEQFFIADYNGRRLTCVARPVDYWGLLIVSVVDTGRSTERESAARYVLLAGIAVAIVTTAITVLILSRLTRPLKTLARRMSKLKSGDLTERLPVAGEYEIRELTSAYNYMMDSLNSYINQIKQIEQEKRGAEIRALQTQIHPHFIYNTLSSVKWLIWRGENEKASHAIESFIVLIKNMISDKTEMIPLKDEVENLKNYAMLQQIRYGDHIRVVFNISDGCLDAIIPKMIIQPIIENAFFHAFADSKDGTINVFAGKSGGALVVEVIDDGAGISGVKFERASCAQVNEKCGFSGVGLINVDERLRLLFGGVGSYIAITSEQGVGTVVRVTIPSPLQS